MAGATDTESASQERGTLAERLGQAFSPRYLSLGLLWSWMSCAWTAGEGAQGADAGIAIFSGQAWLPSAIFVVMGLFGLPALLRHRARLPLWLVALFALATCAGTALRPLAGDDAALTLALGILTGFGSAGLLIGGTAVLARLDTERIETVLPANALVTAVCGLLYSAMHDAGSLAFASALPLLAGVLLAMAVAGQDSPQDSSLACDGQAGQNAGQATRAPHGEVAAALLTNLAAFIAICFLESCLPASLVARSDTLLSLVTAAASLALIMLVIGNSVRVDATRLYRWVMPLLACLLAVSLIGGHAIGTAVYLVSEIIDFSLLVLLGMYFVGLAHTGRMGGVMAAGLCYGSCQLGVLLGNLLGMGAAGAESGTLLATVGCICLVSLAGALLPWIASRAGGARQAGAQAVRAAEGVSQPADAEKPGEPNALDAACDAVASEFGLSAREREVLAFLARGRTQPYIREALLLSKNTVSSHVQHIYAKLGVHSKQELIDLVEARV